MLTIKLAIAVIAFILSGGQIVFQTFQHHQAVNPKHGLIKTFVFIISFLSLIYLAKDIYADFEQEKTLTAAGKSVATPAEIAYWHAIDKTSSPEDYCAYLEKYPQGEFVAIAKNRIQGDCLQVKQQAEAELKAKFDSEAKALVEKSQAEAQANADKLKARIEALESAKTEAELIKPVPDTDTRLEVELKAKFESDSGLVAESSGLPTEQEKTTAEEEPLF